MPSTFNADKVASTVQSKVGLTTISITGEYTVSTNLAANDIIQMVKVPKGAVVQEVIVSSSATIGSTATAEVGDGSATGRFVSSGTFGQGAASLTRLNVAGGHGYKYTAEDTIDIKILTMSGAATAAVIRLTAIYTLNN